MKILNILALMLFVNINQLQAAEMTPEAEETVDVCALLREYMQRKSSENHINIQCKEVKNISREEFEHKITEVMAQLEESDYKQVRKLVLLSKN